ncbi:MAG: NINE protein [Turicibacter sp.]|nr:NINE protein [Turicibacter sp.]MDO5794643.1 NINE protein [Turicibacter sp.]
MYCRNCGKELNENADYCTNCGVATTKGNSYCSACGAETNENADVCVKCGANLSKQKKEPKSKIAAGLLGVFLGVFGVHRFYLGYTTIGVIQLVLSVVLGIFTCGISTAAISIWGFIEGILIICGSVITTDADGNPLQ